MQIAPNRRTLAHLDGWLAHAVQTYGMTIQDDDVFLLDVLRL